MNAAGNWNKIDWEKGHDFDNRLGNEDPSVWEDLAKESGVLLDADGNLPIDWTWEQAFKIGLPMKTGIYLCYFSEDEIEEVCSYDDENTTPCFWDGSDNICYPDFWAKINKPK